ncbi:hypothetical protein PG989_009985 [Apiospora arundinis]|uniref:Uncharacterized protein n=1 Tax=Apiospora arundinis TaxID=335852 RepID=A0ABR2JAP6_9PEZI
MPSIKTALPTAVSAVLLLAGVSQAGQFAMYKYTPPSIDNPEYKAGYYFLELNDYGIPAEGVNMCDRRQIWPFNDPIHDDQHTGVRVKPRDSNHPDEIEVNWGKGEGHWTYRKNHGGKGQNGIWDLNDIRQGDCTPAADPPMTHPCSDSGLFGTVSHVLSCKSTYFELPGSHTSPKASEPPKEPSGPGKSISDWTKFWDVLVNALFKVNFDNNSVSVANSTVDFPDINLNLDATDLSTNNIGAVNFPFPRPDNLASPTIILPDKIHIIKDSASNVSNRDGVTIKIAA